MDSPKELRKYGIEMLVIIFGILIAFQVEEWREGLQQERDLQASLVRLKEETAFNLELCAGAISNALRPADDTLFIVNVVQTGQVDPDDVSRFETGLTRMAAMCKPPYISTVAEEMIATGLRKELQNSELRVRVAALLSDWMAGWRIGPAEVDSTKTTL